MKERGWEQADFVYICGDAYVDHPSFGAAIITRLLEDAGYKVAFIAQPDWNDEQHCRMRGAKTGIYCICRKHGFYGEPLYIL